MMHYTQDTMVYPTSKTPYLGSDSSVNSTSGSKLLRAITGYGFSLRDMVKLSIQDIAISTVTITSQD